MSRREFPSYLRLVQPDEVPSTNPDSLPVSNFSSVDILNLPDDTVNDMYKRYSTFPVAFDFLNRLSDWELKRGLSKTDKGILFVMAMTAQSLNNTGLFSALRAFIVKGEPLIENNLVEFGGKIKDYLLNLKIEKE